MKFISILFVLSFSVASLNAASTQSTMQKRLSNGYQITKKETIKIGKETGSAMKSGYNKSKNWVSKEWDKRGHKNKKSKKVI
jgi:hypothetical protein